MRSVRTVQVCFGEDSGDQVSRNYPIVIGDGVLSDIGSIIPLDRYSSIAVICDENVVTHWLPSLRRSLTTASPPGRSIGVITVSAGEQHKGIPDTERVWNEMTHLGLDRHSLVLNLGGGMVGDLGGFAASCYMRGLDFVQVPTSLLAQVDASVGGKVGVNFAGIKNLLGSFSQPRAVVIDLATLSTLPDREYTSGFAEILKHGLIRDRGYFERCRALGRTRGSSAELLDVVDGSCKIKARIVLEDEREQGVRKLLNFGHTLGHALESLSFESGTPLLHGEAVALGMAGEAYISHKEGLLSSDALSAVESAIGSVGLPVNWSTRSDLTDAATVERPAIDAVLEKMKYDKKNEGSRVNWTLLDGIGSARYDQSAAPQVIRAAVERVLA